MDPLTSLGVAGNVIQFVDFGIKLVSKFNQIYHSADGALQENAELNEIATRLKTIAGPLAASTPDADPELENIALSCLDASNELLALLAGLQSRASKHRKLSAVGVTFKSVMKERVVRDLNSKLQRLQQQLNTRLLVLLHGSNGLLTTQIAEIIDANQRFRQDTTVSLDKLIRELGKFQKLGQSVIYLPEIGQQIDALTEESKLADKRRRILKSLRYNIMYDRFEDVVKAYGNTFQWVLNDPALGFSGWLKSPSARTYWITGKPGSGKSTLMKYIHQHPKTRESLQEWAGSDRLVIANHFFWVSGDQLQRHQIGLLRSLLYQILRECPHLIESVCEMRWNEDELAWDEPWNLRTLSSCFERLANHEALDAKICLFIDGLDEYDGDHRELIRLLRDLTRSSNSQLFKLCVSSRPWNVFEAEYGGLLDKLSVHELTSNDILSYVNCNLHEDQYLSEILTAEHHRSSELIHMITEKAQGVFLWVHYVVRLLLKIAVDCPTMSDLVRIVYDYPDELDPLFERILAAIPKVYRRDTAQMIKICLDSVSPPSLVVLWSAEKEIENEEYALQKDITKLTKDDLKEIQKFEQRLKGKCMDFIEVHLSGSGLHPDVPPVVFHQVDFFHRTVRDFLHMRRGWINDWAGKTFDVHLAMCRAILGFFKTLPSPIYAWNVDNYLIARNLYQFFTSAHILETDRGLTVRPLLEELDNVLKACITTTENFHWSGLIHKVFSKTSQSDRRQSAGPTFRTNLSHVAVQTGLLLYAREEIRTNPPKGSEPFLQHALVPNPPLAGFSALNPEVIRHLLECGADPNDNYGDQSVWCEFLRRCLEKEELGDQCLDSASVRTIELLLEYGASMDAICDTRPPNERYQFIETPGAFISVEEILRRLHPDKSRLLTLLAEARERRARQQLDSGIPDREDTGTMSPAWDLQSGVELRSDCANLASGITEPRGVRLEAWSRGAELRGDRSETRSEGLEPRVEKPQPGKRKMRWRLWVFLKRILT